MSGNTRKAFRVLAAMVFLGAMLACTFFSRLYHDMAGMSYETDSPVLTSQARYVQTLAAQQADFSDTLTARVAQQGNNQNPGSPNTGQQPQQNQPLVQNPFSQASELNYKGLNSPRYYLDLASNTWKCDDTTLYADTFTLHFYPDESIFMDNSQLNYTSIPSNFRFKRDNSSDWTFSGSDLTSSDIQLSFPGGQNGNFDTVVIIYTLKEPNGNPGTCTYEFTLAFP